MNRIQSIVYETAYKTNENLLISAPTGAGKTNVALLTVVKTVKNFIENGVVQRNKFKVNQHVSPSSIHTSHVSLNLSKLSQTICYVPNCILHQHGLGFDRFTHLSINSLHFQIVYITPMKALASEMTKTFGKKLQGLGIQVRELTGDMQLTKQEISQTQMLIVTPEKWDVVTRKGTGDTALSQLVRLLIIGG